MDWDEIYDDYDEHRCSECALFTRGRAGNGKGIAENPAEL